MKETLQLINKAIRESEPDKYDSMSYGAYYNILTKISDSILKETSSIKDEILKIEDSELKNKLMEFLCEM